MRCRFVLSVLLIAAVLFTLCACSTEGKTQNNASGASSSIPASTETALPHPTGADSVQALLEKSLDYLHSGDYGKIADVHDPAAYLAYFFMEDVCDDQDLTFAQAREKAALVYGSADELEKADPALAAAILEELDVEDPDEAFNDYMSELRDAVRSGEIGEDDPNYETYSAMLADWDKGADYVYSHYPEVFEKAAASGTVFNLDGALDQLRKFARFELFHSDLEHFQTLECEYRPENTYVDESGICSYQMGSLIDDGSSWWIDMLYYVENEVYYLIGFSVAVGGVGG